VPLSTSKSSFHQQLYEFVGKWMGLALRSRSLISLNLPSVVWKQLINDNVTEDDIVAIDKSAWQVLDQIRALESAPAMTAELFDRKMSDVRFAAYGSDGKMRPLIDGGDKKPLTWSNRQQFIREYRKFRVSEFAVQCAAMRRGLSMVVPVQVLSLFSWRELEAQVCGRGITLEQVDLLEKMTSYSGYNATDAHIRMFWDMYRKRFTDEQRAQWLVFVWGRSRLPLSEADFSSRMTISVHNKTSGDQNTLFPIGHTCGFSVELPRYTDPEKMYQRIVWAITNSGEIDADGGSASMSGRVQVADDDDEPSLF